MTLEQIRPLNAGLHWKKVETLFKRLGAEVYEGRGSTVTFVLEGRKLTVDRPHPRRECGRGLVKRIRSFLEGLGRLCTQRGIEMIEYQGYTGVFEFDPELRLFTGHVVDLRDEIYFEGDSVEALEASMGRAVDQYLEVCRARGEEPERPFSGKLNVRLGSEVHRAAAVAAAAEGESLNAWLARVVEEAARNPKRLRQGTKAKASRHRKTPASKVGKRTK